MGTAFADPGKYADSVIQMYLDQAQLSVSEAVFRGYFKLAVYNLAAHELFLRGQQDWLASLDPTGNASALPQGVLSSSGAGDLSKQMDMPSYDRKDDKFLASTVYGQQYIKLRNKMGRGAVLAMQRPNNPIIPVIPWH